ncbi:MAG TPA: DUF29 domain-containing protein [Geminicoccaceae bacterium]|nr:DUF29 domain-containing protein [Geminicoccaceae bacterium]
MRLERRAERLYDEDFFAWTRAQARELRRFARTRPNLPLDLAHVAEEIADLGTERRDALRSWTGRIIEHPLLLEHSHAREPRRGRIDEVINFRSEVDGRPTPTLRRDLTRRFDRLYDRAHRNLRRKLELYGEAEVAARLPERCPYTLDQILGDFWPAPHGDRTDF